MQKFRELWQLVVCMVGCWITVGFGAEYDYTVNIPAGKTECYFQPVDRPDYKTMEIGYQVIDGGDLDINFKLKLKNTVLVEEQRKSDSMHRIDLKELGDYELCFDNSFSQQSRKLVFFEIFILNENNTTETYDSSSFGAAKVSGSYAETGVTIGDFHATSGRIKDHLNKIESYQSVVRAFEARDRAIMNANYSRVTFWSIVNSVVLVLVGLLQVFMIRSLFDDSSKVNQLLRQVD